MLDLTLPNGVATALFVLGCWCGYQYRRVWKNEGPKWQLWVYGLTTAISFLTVGLIPLAAA